MTKLLSALGRAAVILAFPAVAEFTVGDQVGIEAFENDESPGAAS
jgi:hypothetical protein